MNIVDRIKELCSSKGTNMATLERELCLSKGSISKWAKSSPNSDGLQKVADYFYVSVDYLLGREEQPDEVLFLCSHNGVLLFDLIKNLCLTKDISISRLEKELGLSNGSIKKWSKTIPSGDRLAKVADYFHVSVDYLLGREPNHNFFDFQFSISRSVHLTEEDKEKLINTFKDITNLYLDAKNTR